MYDDYIKAATETMITYMENEGYVFSESQMNIYGDIALGFITLDEAREGVLSMIDTFRSERPDWFCQGEPKPDKDNKCCYEGTETPFNKWGIINESIWLKIEFEFFFLDEIEKLKDIFKTGDFDEYILPVDTIEN